MNILSQLFYHNYIFIFINPINKLTNFTVTKLKFIIMKNIIKIVFVLASSILMFTACDKDNEDQNNDNSNISNFIIGKDNGAVTITAFSPAVIIYGEGSSYQNHLIDMNNDGVNDIDLRSYFSVSPGGVNNKYSYIKSINPSFEISSILSVDTIYLCNEQENDTITHFTFFNSASGFSCSGVIDSVLAPYTTNCSQIYSNGENIDSNTIWSSNELMFSNFNNSASFWDNKFTEYNILIGNWNNQDLMYVLVKYNNNGTIRYGWIKIGVEDYRKVTIYEYAM